MQLQTLCTVVLINILSTIVTFADEPKPTITVRGSAQVSLQADSAMLSFKLEGRSLDAEKAFEKIDRQTQAVVAMLKQNQIADSEIRLQPIMIMSYQTEPRGSKGKMANRNQASSKQANAQNTAEDDEESSEQTAYQATRQIAVSVSNLTRLNPIHLGLAKSGVERIDKLEFKSSKSVEEYAKLRQAAVREARTKAKEMAGELGAVLSSIKTMTDQSQPLPVHHSSAGSDSDDPFGMMGGYGSSNRSSPSSTTITHVAAIDVVFYLGNTELNQ